MRKLPGKDNRGQVFLDGNRVIRIVSRKYYPEVTEILKLIESRDFYAGKIVKTNLDLAEGYLVHEKQTISYPHEWTPNMLKDAAIFYLKLVKELDNEQIVIKDALPTNILFNSTQPIFIDFNSLILSSNINNEEWLIKRSKFKDHRFQILNEHFYPYFLIPLLHSNTNCKDFQHFLIKGAPHIGELVPTFKHIDKKNVEGLLHYLKLIAKIIIKANDYSIRELTISFYKGMKQLLHSGKFQTVLIKSNKYRKKFKLDERTSYIDTVNYLIAELDKLNVDNFNSSYLSYYSGKKEDFDLKNDNKWNNKQKSVCYLLKKIQPDSVLDLGSNTGWFSFLAADLGSRVISIDSDISCVDSIYLEAKKKQLSITPLVVDFLKIQSEYYIEPKTVNSDPFYLSPISRLESDLVLCLGLIHHLVLGLGLTFENIFQILDKLSKRAIIIEYIDILDEKIQSNTNFFPEYLSSNSEYNYDSFLKCFGTFFRIVEIHESNPDTRMIIYAEKLK